MTEKPIEVLPPQSPANTAASQAAANTPPAQAPSPALSNHNPTQEGLNLPVFLVSAAVILAVAIGAILAPNTIQAIFDHAVAWTGRWFGSFYILLITVVLVFVVILAMSRFGRIRLGPDNSTPDFSTFSWAAMLFAAGVGTGIMFYAVAEPVSQYLSPPTGPGQTPQAARQAVVLTLFHYGISGWGLYSLVGMALGYMAYRHHQPLTVRSTLRPLLGDRVNGPLGDAVDAAALIGGVFGIAASLGVGVVQLNVALGILFHVPHGTAAQIGLISLSVLMAIVSAVSGVDRGVRVLSNVNVLLAVGLALWVLLTGKTAFLLDALVANIGDFITQFPQLTLETYPYNHPTEWLSSWTLFFWAWWITWAAFVGMFLARISRGRTIREFVTGSLVLPFSYVLMWVSLFGNSALDLIRSGQAPTLAEATTKAPEQGLYELLGRLPGGPALIALALFVGILFYVTSADSGALVMANLCSRARQERRDAAAWLRVFWATVTGILTIAMLVAGGIPILQQATIVMALPFSLAVIAVMAGLWKALRAELQHEDARQIANRNRLLAASGSAAAASRSSWRDRLSHTFDLVSPARAQRALERRVVPALEAVAIELRKEDLTAEVLVEGPEAQDPDDERQFLGRASLVVTSPDVVEYAAQEGRTVTERVERASGTRVFRYVVRLVEVPAPAYGAVVHEADDVSVRLEVRPRSGGQGYDVMDWSADQVAHDVLDHYERWLEYLASTSVVSG
ncbi:choline BCCT transporter BetT [Actinomyces trachealis]|uniref:choline BCCT transporter BetT n=1 Tax=Actinomyces trachealis TaxID=2763540 RepID=UPI0018C75418|nr:choline BCCT transporter BetT [Actinomyces trachealis]